MSSSYSSSVPDEAEQAATPGLRLLQLLELVCSAPEPQTLVDVVRLSGQPKPSVHRMLQQLEAGGLLARGGDGRRYAITPRLMRFAETVLRGSTSTGVRHAVLRQLVADVGETCNLTALSGAEVIYLDRVETRSITTTANLAELWMGRPTSEAAGALGFDLFDEAAS